MSFRFQVDEGLARLRAGVDDAAAAVEDRALRLGQKLDRLRYAVGFAPDLRVVALVLDCLGPDIGRCGELHVLRQVDDDRAGPAATRPVKGDRKSTRLNSSH